MLTAKSGQEEGEVQSAALQAFDYETSTWTIIFLEVIMACSLDEVDTGAVMSGRIINNLRFADDIAVLAENQDDLQGMINRIVAESTRMGMKVNTGKTEVQYIGPKKTKVDIKIENCELKQVEEFVYLGGNMSEDASTDQELRRRIGLACGAMQNLNPIWKSKDISINTKSRVYEALVLNILLYNC